MVKVKKGEGYEFDNFNLTAYQLDESKFDLKPFPKMLP